MYEVDGNFGRVRLANLLHTPLESHGLFSLDAVGWHRCNEQYHITRPRGCATHLLLITMRGEGRLHMAGTTYTLTAGSLALVPSGIAHAYRAVPGGWWEFYWLHTYQGISQELLDESLRQQPSPVTWEIVTHHYAQWIESLLTLCHQKPPYFEWTLSEILSSLLHRAASDRLHRSVSAASPLSDRAIVYMEQHFSRPLTVEQMANSLYVSKAHLIREFHKQTGYTPHAYLLEYRVSQAEQLLRFTSKSVSEIAAQTGFSSASHMISRFQKSRGMTPVAYRNTECVRCDTIP